MSNAKTRTLKTLRPSQKLVHLCVLWLFSGMGFLGLGVFYVIKSYEDIAGNNAEHLLWLNQVVKLLPLELILIGSVIPIMLIGFFFARRVGMPLAKHLTLMLIHRRLCKKTYTLLLWSPLGVLGLIYVLPFVDLRYVLGLIFGIAYFNCGFIFTKFSAALKAYSD